MLARAALSAGGSDEGEMDACVQHARRHSTRESNSQIQEVNDSVEYTARSTAQSRPQQQTD
eukprot:1996801-Rhodomonas_salina.1